MRTLNARIYVRIELDDGNSREFDLDYGTVRIESDGDETIVDVIDNCGDILSSTEDGSGAIATRVGPWLAELGIRDEEADEEE